MILFIGIFKKCVNIKNLDQKSGGSNVDDDLAQTDLTRLLFLKPKHLNPLTEQTQYANSDTTPGNIINLLELCNERNVKFF